MAYPNFGYTLGQPVYMNAMGRSPVPAGSSAAWGPAPDHVTLSPEASAAVSGGGANAGADWLQLLQATAPFLQQLQARGERPRSAAPALQATPGNAAAAAPLLALMQRQPLTDPNARALPGLLG